MGNKKIDWFFFSTDFNEKNSSRQSWKKIFIQLYYLRNILTLNKMRQNLFDSLFFQIHKIKIETMYNPNTIQIRQADEKTHFMRYDNTTFVAEDSIASNAFHINGYGYRKVYFTDEVEKNKTLFGLGTDKIFFDDEWDIRATENLANLDPNNPERVILRRLSHLYPTNPELRPKFFPDNDFNQPLKKVTNVRTVPHFLHEMGLFPSSEFRSLFFTQDFQASGMYHAVVNYNGRWQTDVIDDFIPVYEKSGKPLWGMDLEQPWQLILLKFWAKRNFVLARDNNYDPTIYGGYVGVLNSAPFEFVNCFSNSNWKFINLTYDFDKFVRGNAHRVHKGHFILKTKNSNFVSESGLIPNEACYELVNLVEDGGSRNSSSNVRGGSPSKYGGNKVNYIATIRSSNKVAWTGKKSVLDNEFKNVHRSMMHQHADSSRYVEQQTAHDKKADSFGLDRYFTVEGQDLKNLFSACYITTRRVGTNNVSGFFKFTYPANRTNAIYLEFDVEEQTFLDFSIKQHPSNKIAPTGKSKLAFESYQREFGGRRATGERYLTNKYILVKDNSKSDTTPMQDEFERDYKRLNYQTYEIEYLKGYNNGDAHFLKAVKGRYILRIKSEPINRDAYYVLNYCAKNEIHFKEIRPTKEEETKIMKDAMASTIDKVPRMNLRQGDESQVVAYGDTFDYVGYGYVGVRIKKHSNSQILIDVDPEQLKNEGYRLKHIYKHETQPFAIVVSPGESTCVVLKRSKNVEATHWPPKGIAIFQK